MPNWVYNGLEIRGPLAVLTRFASENKRDDELLSFEKSVPLDTTADGETDWESAGNVWGTNKEAFWVERSWGLDGDQHRLHYNFSSAWEPPTTYVKTVSKKYPELTFCLKYSEESNDFSGIFTACNGDVDAVEGDFQEYTSYYSDDSDSDDDNEVQEVAEPADAILV